MALNSRLINTCVREIPPDVHVFEVLRYMNEDCYGDSSVFPPHAT